MAGESEATTAMEHATDAAHGAADAAHAAEGAGMPQLDFSTFPNQIFWLIVTILAIYYVLSKVALPRIASVLAERRGTITNDIAAAEELKLKAVEAEKAYQKALAEARTEAQKIAADARAAIKEELDVATDKADAEIAAKTAESQARIAEIRDSAMSAVEAVAKETAGEIVSALGRPVDAAAVAASVDARLKGGA
ncbi:F0F1 ATP synthase subunit B' [Tropicimonas sediminicola]|uniref:ATP synthase subunit b n=1 Tax=Tropicimonas sediminicola TaxID=1031541 RepID=A0A239CL30_9RHOB|nr:F0F1 ATP synthase subunit B' [Tropicimonas sediminicola]SNS20867.1 F-type H+-transporting ATPase subunit b [Tropicimonas sediminicola]